VIPGLLRVFGSKVNGAVQRRPWDKAVGHLLLLLSCVHYRGLSVLQKLCESITPQSWEHLDVTWDLSPPLPPTHMHTYTHTPSTSPLQAQ